MTRTSESVASSSSTLATTASNADLSQLDRVTVIVVTFESAHCLPTLSRLLKACPHVILVDNGSRDGSASIAQSMLPHAQVIALERNLGFGSANNRALDRVATPYAFLLNPDCEIEVEDLAILVQEAMRFPDAAIIAPQLTNARGEPDLSYRWPSTHWVSRGPGASAPLCVGFVCGAAMLFVMDNMRGADRFDERFFLYYEDDDLCLRIFERRLAIILVPLGGRPAAAARRIPARLSSCAVKTHLCREAHRPGIGEAPAYPHTGARPGGLAAQTHRFLAPNARPTKRTDRRPDPLETP